MAGALRSGRCFMKSPVPLAACGIFAVRLGGRRVSGAGTSYRAFPWRGLSLRVRLCAALRGKDVGSHRSVLIVPRVCPRRPQGELRGAAVC